MKRLTAPSRLLFLFKAELIFSRLLCLPRRDNVSNSDWWLLSFFFYFFFVPALLLRAAAVCDIPPVRAQWQFLGLLPTSPIWLDSRSRDGVFITFTLWANPYFTLGCEAPTGNSKAVLFSPDRENTSPALRAAGLEKH